MHTTTSRQTPGCSGEGMSFTGGKLKLKGQDGGVKKKKKKKQSGEDAEKALVPVQLGDGEAAAVVGKVGGGHSVALHA